MASISPKRVIISGSGDDERVSGAKVFAWLVLFIIILAVLAASFVNVPAGYKGVIVSSPTGPSTKEINEGWHFNPMYAVSDIEIIRYNVQTRDMTSGSTVTVRSADNLNIKMDISLIFHMPPDKVADNRIQYGDMTTLIDRYIRNVPRDVASHYNATYIGGDGRGEVEKNIRTNLTAALGNYNIIVDDVLIRSIDLPDTVDQSIEAKKQAEQNMIAAEYNYETTLTNARADADAQIIAAHGEANATVIHAEGQALAIAEVQEQLARTYGNDSNVTYDPVQVYLTWLYIKALSDPNSNVQYVILTDGSGNPIILDLGTTIGSGTNETASP